jgi:GT2 family glycosyltransferase
MRPLIVIPAYVSSERALDITARCLSSLSRTDAGAGDAEVLVVDDASPVPFGPEIERIAAFGGYGYARQDRNAGFSAAVNVGLREALETGRDAVLLNADVEFEDRFWIRGFREHRAHAEVQGALLSFPGAHPRLVQHAGVYFSVLRREFDHVSRFALEDLPDLGEWRRCPVTAALMQIRHDCLERVGLFDEGFSMGWEDVDYCLRVFAAGGECWYNPLVRAVHHENAFRSEPSPKRQLWTRKSHQRLWDKHAGEDFSAWVPTMLGI